MIKYTREACYHLSTFNSIHRGNQIILNILLAVNSPLDEYIGCHIPVILPSPGLLEYSFVHSS